MPYIDPKEIERIKQIDLLSYLMSNDPDELVRKSAREYTTKTHDSLVISNGKWHQFSRGIGGKSALSYLIKVKDMSFFEAARHLIEAGTIPRYPLPVSRADAKPTAANFLLPPRNSNSDKARSYLELRGIDPLIISECMKQGLIYETHTMNSVNAVFVGTDSFSKPRYAFLRGCTGDFKGEAAGSDKRFSFRLRSRKGNPSCHIFESAIDALSYATLLLRNDRDWRDENLLSLGGIQVPSPYYYDRDRIPQSLAQWLKDEPKTKAVILHLDNDTAGLNAANALATALYGRVDTIIAPPPPAYKDVNEYLLAAYNPSEAIPLERQPLTIGTRKPKQHSARSR